VARQRLYDSPAARQRAYRQRKGARQGEVSAPTQEQTITVLHTPLRVTDAEGRLLLDMARGGDGSPVLRLFGPEGRPAVTLMGRGAGGLVAIYGSDGELSAILHAGRTGGELRRYDCHGEEK
jgi:hypothetical protein